MATDDKLVRIETKSHGAGNGTIRSRKIKWYKNPKLWRQGTMLFFFVFLIRVAIHHLQQGGGPNGTPSVEAYCPFGGLESLYQFMTTGGFIRRIEPSAMIIFGAVLLLTLLFSRGFCGWVCPFGSIQEWIGMIGKKIFKKRYNPTGSWDHALRYFKYVVLVFIIALTWWSGTMVFRDYDPFLAFFHLGEGIDERPWAYGILVVVLIGSLFIERFFCKYACPLGAVLGLLGKVGLTKVHRDPTDCKDCNVCFEKCHAHIDFLSTEDIRSAECNHCLDCVVDCPRPNVLTVRATKWRFTQPVYASVLIIGLFGLIGVSQATNTWRTKPETVEVRDQTGNLVAGQIRGWMTLNTISEEYGIPVERLYADSGLPPRVPPDLMIKDIHKEYEIEFEPDSLRDVVDAYLSGEQPPDLEARRPERRTRRAEYAEANPDKAEAHQRSAGRGGPGQGLGRDQGEGSAKGKGNPDEGPGEPPAVRGNSTINEIVLKTGISKDYLLKEAGLPDDVPTREPLRDWISDYDKTPRDLREVVEKYQAEKK